MKTQAIIFFTKVGKTHVITNYISDLDLSSITDMSEFVLEKTNLLSTFFLEDGNYQFIGLVEKKRVKFHLEMRAFLKL